MFRLFIVQPNRYSFHSIQQYNRALNYFLIHKKPLDKLNDKIVFLQESIQDDNIHDDIISNVLKNEISNRLIYENAIVKSNKKLDRKLNVKSDTNEIFKLNNNENNFQDEEIVSVEIKVANGDEMYGEPHFTNTQVNTENMRKRKLNKMNILPKFSMKSFKEHIRLNLIQTNSNDYILFDKSSINQELENWLLPHTEILLLENYEDINKILKKYRIEDILDSELVYCILLRLKQHLKIKNQNLIEIKNEQIQQQKKIHHSQKKLSNQQNVSNNQPIQYTSRDIESFSELERWLELLYKYNISEINFEESLDSNHEIKSKYDSKRNLHNSPLKGKIILQSLILDCCCTFEDISKLFQFLTEKKEVSIIQKMWGVFSQTKKLNSILMLYHQLGIEIDWQISPHPTTLIHNYFKDMNQDSKPNMLMHESFIIAVLIIFVQSRRDWKFIKDYYPSTPKFLKDGGHSDILLDLIREATLESEYELLEYIYPSLNDSLLMKYYAFRIIMELSLKKKDFIRFITIFIQYDQLLKENPKFFSRDKFNSGNRTEELLEWLDPLNSQEMEDLFDIILDQSISSNALVSACMCKFAHLFVWEKVKEIHSILREKEIPFPPIAYSHIFESCEKSRNILVGVWYMHDLISNSSMINQEAVTAFIKLGSIAEDFSSKNEWINTLIRLVTNRKYLIRNEAMVALLETNKKTSTMKILDRIIENIEDDNLRAEQKSHITTGRHIFLNS